MKPNKLLPLGLCGLAVVLGGALAALTQPKAVSVEASTGYTTTSLGTYYDSCPNPYDSNYYKTMEENVDYPLGDGSVINLRFNRGTTSQIPQIRNYKNESNYYIYIKYNPSHNEVGQLGAELIFNAQEGYLLDSVDMYNGYQVGDAFQIQIFDQNTASYVADASDQMFSSSNATYSYTFSKPTSSFKIVHYLHSTSTHSVIAWKETKVYYETAHTLTFDSQGGTSVASQSYLENSSDVTFAPTVPTRASVGTTQYTFDGWYTDAQCTAGNEFTFGQALTSNVTLYAKWKETQVSGFTMTFNTMGGGFIAAQVATPGSKFIQPNNPTKESDGKYTYSFTNWYTDEALAT